MRIRIAGGWAGFVGSNAGRLVAVASSLGLAFSVLAAGRRPSRQDLEPGEPCRRINPERELNFVITKSGFMVNDAGLSPQTSLCIQQLGTVTLSLASGFAPADGGTFTLDFTNIIDGGMGLFIDGGDTLTFTKGFTVSARGIVSEEVEGQRFLINGTYPDGGAAVVRPVSRDTNTTNNGTLQVATSTGNEDEPDAGRR